MNSRTITAATGTPTVGLWCDRCLLPSAFTADLLTLTADGVSVLGTLRRCIQCGA